MASTKFKTRFKPSTRLVASPVSKRRLEVKGKGLANLHMSMSLQQCSTLSTEGLHLNCRANMPRFFFAEAMRKVDFC